MTAWGKKLKKDWEHHAARVSFAKRKEFVHFNIGLTVDSLIPMGENLIWKGLQGEWSKVELRRHFLPPVFIPPLYNCYWYLSRYNANGWRWSVSHLCAVFFPLRAVERSEEVGHRLAPIGWPHFHFREVFADQQLHKMCFKLQTDLLFYKTHLKVFKRLLVVI